jgi:hypothetical protein
MWKISLLNMTTLCNKVNQSINQSIAICEKFTYLKFVEIGSGRLSGDDLKSIPYADLVKFIFRSGRYRQATSGPTDHPGRESYSMGGWWTFS